MKLKAFFLLSFGLLFSACSLIPRSPKNVLPGAESIELPALFSDHVVLQQGKPAAVWGWAKPGSGWVRVALGNQVKTCQVDSSGRWETALAPLVAGGPFELKVIGQDTLTVRDVLIGEVWICSGQSNMAWTVGRSDSADAEIASAHWPQIRMFTLPRVVGEKPQSLCEGAWEVCSPLSVAEFSAAGYFFGKNLHQHLNVPIGLIHTSWGGTPAEAWTMRETLENNPLFQPIVQRYDDAIENYPQAYHAYEEALKEFESRKGQLPTYQIDAGNKGLAQGWADAEFDDASWSSMSLPGAWEQRAHLLIDGALWFRKTIRIPETWQGTALTLSLGMVDDFDDTYFNGIRVGGMGKETPNSYSIPRKYSIRSSLVQPGVNVIAVRVFDHFGDGGFTGGPRQLFIQSEAQEENLSLAGQWQYKIETELSPGAITGPGGSGRPQPPMGPGHYHSPAGLYNAMIHPLIPYSIQGAIWYQGEANANRAWQYRALLPAMIQDWRVQFGQGDFPFGIVQLANFMARDKEPSESAWAELREAQLMTAQKDPNTGLAVIIDIGDADDIHPTNKQDVGKRLALWARHQVYGEAVVHSGPEYEAMTIQGNQAVLEFKFAESGLTARGDVLKGFAIAGEDQKFKWAKAEIQGQRVIVWHPDIEKPAAVRYGWGNNPECTLYNGAGLPASPFRTDAFEAITDQKL